MCTLPNSDVVSCHFVFVLFCQKTKKNWTCWDSIFDPNWRTPSRKITFNLQKKRVKKQTSHGCIRGRSWDLWQFDKSEENSPTTVLEARPLGPRSKVTVIFGAVLVAAPKVATWSSYIHGVTWTCYAKESASVCVFRPAVGRQALTETPWRPIWLRVLLHWGYDGVSECFQTGFRQSQC